MQTILLFFWITVALYGGSAVCYFLEFFQKQERFLRPGFLFACAGFVFHTICLSLYWSRPGFYSFSTFEVINDAAWSGICVFLVVSLISKRAATGGVFGYAVHHAYHGLGSGFQ